VLDISEPIKFSESEVFTNLKTLKRDKSPGPDQIHPRILYELCYVLCGILAKLFNLSMSQGLLPEIWKKSTIAVIFNKGKKDTLSNYRPISLTCITCKI